MTGFEELFDPGSGFWILDNYVHEQNAIAGNPLPLDAYLGYGTVVPVDDTFLIVGGMHCYMFLDTIYRYERDSDSWTRLDTELPGYVAAPVAMMVDIDIFPTC